MHHPCGCLLSAPNSSGIDLSGYPFTGLKIAKNTTLHIAGEDCRAFRCPCADNLHHDQQQLSELCMILMAAIEIRHDTTLHIG